MTEIAPLEQQSSVDNPPHPESLHHHTYDRYGPTALEIIDHEDVHEHYRLRDIFKRPRVLQWRHNNKIYRGNEERSSNHFELFFDLLFVGIVHQLADGSTINPSGYSLAQFVLTFYPSWSIWSDVRDLYNMLGTDDFHQRVYQLWIMALLVGYSVNGSNVDLNEQGPEIDEKNRQNISIAAAFFVAAKGSKIALYFCYAYLLPSFRTALITTCIPPVFIFLLFLVICFPSVPLKAQLILTAVGIGVEVLMRYAVGLFVILSTLADKKDNSDKVNTESSSTNDDIVKRKLRRTTTTDLVRNPRLLLGRTSMNKLRVPALNIEHYVDRLGAFVTIVLGEMVASILYKVNLSSGLSPEFGRSIVSLIAAFGLNWIYFDSDSCQHFLHALRRHWFTSITFINLHWPMCGALILASASVARLVPLTDDAGDPLEPEKETGLRWYFGAGLGTGLACMATIGILHKSLDPPNTTRIRRRYRVTVRFCVAIILILLPMASIERLSTLAFLGVAASVISFVVLFETVGQLSNRPPATDDDREEKVEEEADNNPNSENILEE